MFFDRNARRPGALLMLTTLVLGAAASASADDGLRLYASPSLRLMSPDAKFGVDHNGPAVSLRIGAEVASWLDLQAGVGYGRTTSSSNIFSQTTVGVDGLFLFSREALRPFLLFGIGAESERIRNPVMSGNSTVPSVSIGAGVQYLLDDEFSLQADVRRSIGFQRDKALFNFPRAYTTYIGVGVNYAFDTPAKPATKSVAAPNPVPVPVIVPTPVKPVTPPAPAAAPAPASAQTPAPAPSPAPTQAPASAPETAMEKVTLQSTDLFALNKAKLKQASPQLVSLAATLREHPEISTVVVTGYTDRLGYARRNLALSQARADSVKAFLVAQGIEPGRIRAEGLGSANPVSQCPKMARAKAIACLEPDRRVEIQPILFERPVK